MTNEECLQFVRNARAEVKSAMRDNTLDERQYDQLRQLYYKLDELGGKLIHRIVAEDISKISANVKECRELTEKMSCSMASLNKIVQRVEDTAKAVDGLLKVASAAGLV